MSTPETEAPSPRPASGLAREMGLLGLVATGVCSMVGAGINVIPFMIQRHAPGIGPNVLSAFLFAALPAVLAGLAYAVLASAMPRAGGSYVYASRALDPYLGFVASFSQWFSLCVAIGVVSYLIVPFLRDIAVAAGSTAVAATLETGPIRLAISLAFLWAAVLVNVRGVKAYERLIVPLMFLTFLLGGVVIVAGFSFDHAAFAAALLAREGRAVAATAAPPLTLSVLLPASALMFASFIGFDSIAQAGGEAKTSGTKSAARDRHRRRLGRHFLHALHRRGVPRRAVAVHRRRSAASRPDGPGSAGIPAAAGVDGADRFRGGGRADQGPAGDAARRCRA